MPSLTRIYDVLIGPVFWLAAVVFVGGSLFRITRVLWSVHKKERFIYSYMSGTYALRSIFHWLIPFAATGWRQRPLFTIITFVFHICLLGLPFFVAGHIVLVEQAWGIGWRSLPPGVALYLTGAVIGCLGFFSVRRIVSRDVRYVTTWSDYAILLLVSAPFISGLLAWFQWLNYPFWMLLHILSGEILLVAIPFTRLSHMFFFPLTRAYTGSEFGAVRHSKDW
ncbi:MAG: nitrate reductase [Desulfobacterales bacterium]